MASNVAGINAMTGYVYDADGTRVSKGSIQVWSCNPTTAQYATTSDYIVDLGGQQMSEYRMSTGNQMAWQHTNVWVGGRLIATYSQDSAAPANVQQALLHFYLNDPLGSRRVQTDYAGVTEQSCSNLPYGDGETCTPTPTENLFTGKEHDQESGNDYFDARYYASTMGRFMSPDPSGLHYADPSNPQSMNLYSYVLNNPLVNFDPNGLKCWYVDEYGALTGESSAGDCPVDESGNPTTNDIYIDDEQSTAPWLDSNGDLGGYSNGAGVAVDPAGNQLQTFDMTGNGSGTPLDDQIAPSAMLFVQDVATYTASLPWVCNVGIAGRLGRQNSKFSLGLDASVAGGVRPTGSVNLFNLGGVKGNYTVKGGNQGANLNLPIPTTPFRFSANLTSKHPTFGLGQDVGIPKTNIKANAQLYASFGFLGDASCRGPK